MTKEITKEMTAEDIFIPNDVRWARASRGELIAELREKTNNLLDIFDIANGTFEEDE